MKRTLNKLRRDEKGQALILVLILMLVGGLIIAPLLQYMSTGLKVGKEVFEEKMDGFYAVDAGVEDALYRIKRDDPALPEEWQGVWNKNAYDTSYGPPEYPPFQLNGNDVEVTIQPQWALEGLGETPPHGMTPHSDLLIVGDTIGTDPVTGNGLYQISINFTQDMRTLHIDRIGAWLPAGYSYVEGSSNLEAASGKAHCVPVTEDFRGGKAIKWNFSSPRPKFEDLPGSGNKRIVTFQFTPQGYPLSAFSWVKTGPHDIYLSWDVDIKIYKITSQATDADSGKSVDVEAYAVKNEPRKLGSGMSGDYVAVGNSLMTPDPDDSQSDQANFRSLLYKESSATITTGTDIPANATVEAAYLYWSGWIDHYYWYKSGDNWKWSDDNDNGTGLVYDASNLEQMVETNAKVNTVNFGGGGVQQDITTHDWQVWPKTNDSPACWYYTCFYDATDLVKQLIADDKLNPNGSGTYTLGHASTVVSPPTSNLRSDYEGTSHPKYKTYMFNLCGNNGNPTSDYTGYPLGTPAHKLPSGEWHYHVRYNASYAGWSLIIIYSSPETKGHQLYLYDIANPGFMFKESYPEGASVSNPDFDGDGNPGGKISGFLVPPKISGEVDAAKITCFVGEGDENKYKDYIMVTGENGNSGKLWDYINCTNNTSSDPNNVWNSLSLVLPTGVSGIDIDTFNIPWDSHILEQGDTWAQIDIPTEGDGFTLSYIILSFRSEITTGGTITYLIRG